MTRLFLAAVLVLLSACELYVEGDTAPDATPDAIEGADAMSDASPDADPEDLAEATCEPVCDGTGDPEDCFTRCVRCEIACDHPDPEQCDMCCDAVGAIAPACNP